MMKSGSTFGLSVLILGGAMGLTALAQSNTPVVQTSTDNTATSSTNNSMNPADNSTYATGKPLGDAVQRRLLGSHEPLCPQEVGKEADRPDQGSR